MYLFGVDGLGGSDPGIIVAGGDDLLDLQRCGLGALQFLPSWKVGAHKAIKAVMREKEGDDERIVVK